MHGEGPASRPLVLLLSALALVGGCRCGSRRAAGTKAGAGAAGAQVTLLSTLQQNVAEKVMADVASRAGLRVAATWNDDPAGFLARLLDEREKAGADVYWASDPTQLIRLVKADLVEAYLAPNARTVPDSFKATDGSITGFASRARVIMGSRLAVSDRDLPRSVRDLALPRWKGKIGITDPLAGDMRLQIAAWAAAWGTQAAQLFLVELKRNGVVVVPSENELRMRIARGEIAFGLVGSEQVRAASNDSQPVWVVYPDQEGPLGALLIPTSVALLKGPHRDAGKRFVDALLLPDTEARLAQRGVFVPVRASVPVPPGARSIDGLRVSAVDWWRATEEMDRMTPWLKEWKGY